MKLTTIARKLQARGFVVKHIEPKTPHSHMWLDNYVDFTCQRCNMTAYVTHSEYFCCTFCNLRGRGLKNLFRLLRRATIIGLKVG